MPVVPAPPVEAMPRIAMLLVPVLSMLIPGVKRATSRMSLMPRTSIASWVKAVTLKGTLERLSSWRVAVTTISCSGPASAGASAAAGAAAAAVSAAAGSACTGGAAAVPSASAVKAAARKVFVRSINR